MARPLKVAIVVVGIGVVLVGGVTVAGYAWLQSHKDELVSAGKNAFKDGAHFGAGKQAQACVDEALARVAHVDGILGEASTKVFLEGCLKVAAVDAPFCAGVPPRGEIIASAQWATSRCATAADSQRCARLIGAVQERCLPRQP